MLSIAEVLANPEVYKAMEAVYSAEELQNLIKSQMTPASIKKITLERVSALSEENVLVTLIRVVFLLLSEALDSEQMAELEVLIDFLERQFPETTSSYETAVLLEDTELKNLIKSITKLDVFATRKRSEATEVAAVEEEVPEECPLDAVKTVTI